MNNQINKSDKALAGKMINVLKTKRNLPKSINMAKVAGRFWVECHDVRSDSLMSEQSTTGFSHLPETALMKALSERIEHQAFISGNKIGLKSCMTERSDGFAAYPKCFQDAEIKVREAALAEAIERYVWSTWWGDKQISFQINPLHLTSDNSEIKNYVIQIQTECQVTEILLIEPDVLGLEENKVVILIAQLKSGGYISGGACGLVMNEVILRSLDELYRHGLVILKMKESKIVPKSFYEKRLAYFGLGHGDQIVKKRLSSKGHIPITLPELSIDEIVEHEYSNDYFVHRCFFKNQPPFIGGELERLCL